jgi:hypothetical protein
MESERGSGNSWTASVDRGVLRVAVSVFDVRSRDGSTGERPVKRGELEHAESMAAQIARRASLVAEYWESERRIPLLSGKERALHTPTCSNPIDTRRSRFV